MATLAELQSDLEDLKAARRLGARRVSFSSGGTSQREVEYRSDAELQAAIAATQDEIDRLQGVVKPRVAVVRAHKGW